MHAKWYGTTGTTGTHTLISNLIIEIEEMLNSNEKLKTGPKKNYENEKQGLPTQRSVGVVSLIPAIPRPAMDHPITKLLI